MNFKNGAYPFHNDKVETLVEIQSAVQVDSIIKDEVIALSEALGILSQLICSSIVSHNL